MARSSPIAVSEPDVVCVFVRPQDWNSNKGEPRTTAFAGREWSLSAWHCERVTGLGSQLSELAIDSLVGSKETLFTVGEFAEALYAPLDNSLNKGDLSSSDLEVSVVFRPEPEYVRPKWRTWADAHTQAEHNNGNNKFPPWYRLSLLRIWRRKQA